MMLLESLNIPLTCQVYYIVMDQIESIVIDVDPNLPEKELKYIW